MIYLRYSLEILKTPGAVFTDGNARSTVTKFYLFTGIDDLSKLNAKAINAVKWSGDPEKKRQKQAEVLILDVIPFSQVYDIICYSSQAKKSIVDILQKSGINKHVRINRGWYYVPKSEV